MARAQCRKCGGYLKRVHRTFAERFIYRRILQCSGCGERSTSRHPFLAPHACCPRCETHHITKLRKADPIDPLYRPVLSLAQGLLPGTRLYHCAGCRIQFWDRRPTVKIVPVENTPAQITSSPLVRFLMPKPISPEGRAKLRAIAAHLKPGAISENDRAGLDSRIAEEISADDRRWFAANPDASWRLRRLVPGELPAQPRSRWMLVHQVEPGLRLRTPLGPDIDDETAAFLTRQGYFE